MKLRDIEFTDVWCGSGVLGFVGEGYWWTKLSGLSVESKNLTFVTKTITYLPNAGNVALKENFRPKRIFPETLKINFSKKSVTNKFALANPGLETVLKTNKLQKLKKPFFISIGSTATSREERLKDFQSIKDRLLRERFSASYGVQINFSCPNLFGETKITIDEKISVIELFADTGVPITVKLSPDTMIEDFKMLEDIDCLDAYVFSNTVKTEKGGLSGWLLKKLNVERIRQLRSLGIKKPINAGGGILSKKDAQDYLNAGADSVFIWSVTLLRPWRVLNIVDGKYR